MGWLLEIIANIELMANIFVGPMGLRIIEGLIMGMAKREGFLATFWILDLFYGLAGRKERERKGDEMSDSSPSLPCPVVVCCCWPTSIQVIGESGSQSAFIIQTVTALVYILWLPAD